MRERERECMFATCAWMCVYVCVCACMCVCEEVCTQYKLEMHMVTDTVSF